MYLNDKKIFLAGSTGMVGTSILKYLMENCPRVNVRAAYHTSDPVILDERIEYVSGDLRSLDDCRRMVQGSDCAIMAAAKAGGAGFSKAFPWEHMDENLMMNKQMLEAFRLEGVRRIIFIGSATVYQDFEGSIKEQELDLNKAPNWAYYAYAWGTRFIEKMCEFLHRKYDIEVVIVRAANIFGPHDKFDSKLSTFIPAIIRKAVDKMDPFEIWGDPNVTRDVIYAEDFTRAIVMLTDNTDIKFDIFNLGSGKRTTVGEVADWALRYAKHNPIKIKHVQNKPSAIKFRALDCQKIFNVLGWRPKYSVEEGIKMTTEWWIANQKKWLK